MENFTLLETKFKQFLGSMVNSNWAHIGTEKAIDDIFKSALDLEDIFNQDEKGHFKEIFTKSYPLFNVNRFLDLVLERIIKNQLLDECLTLYAINKYIVLYSKESFLELLDKIVSEVELRSNMYKLIEEFPDVDLDLFTLNKFLSDVLNSTDLKSKIENALKYQTITFLSAIKHSEILTAHYLMNEIINCLEAQTDLRLWFTVMKEQNLDMVLDLCVVYNNFFTAILKFFDKFAEEVESNYDEDLSVQYSHVNMDFEDFVKVFQLFLNQADLKNLTTEYLESKTLNDRNFCFWIDVKACL